VTTSAVAEKLRIKPGTAVWSSDASRLALLGALPDGSSVVDAMAGAATAVLFVDDARSAKALLDAHRDDLARPAALWVAYPKAHRSDIDRDSLWPILAQYGMRPISQVAIDDVWSALRFRALRPDEPPFTGRS
jgi:hypothetical protein